MHLEAVKAQIRKEMVPRYAVEENKKKIMSNFTNIEQLQGEVERIN